LKIQWIFVFLLSLFVIRNFKGPRSSVEMMKGYMVRETLGTLELHGSVAVNALFRTKLKREDSSRYSA